MHIIYTSKGMMKILGCELPIEKYSIYFSVGLKYTHYSNTFSIVGTLVLEERRLMNITNIGCEVVI
jgi:hypothetical protein